MFIDIIWKAIKRLHTEDSDLFENREVKEECLNFRLSLYVLEEIQKSGAAELSDLKRKIAEGAIKIDMEYDKSGNDIKRFYDVPSRADILIHQRLNHENNFAYIEIKKRYRNNSDIRKCRGAKEPPYKYTYSLIIDCLTKELPKARILEIQDDGRIFRHQNPY